MMSKKLLSIITAITLILSLAACGGTQVCSSEVVTEYSAEGDLWVRESIDELAGYSTDVIRAEVLDSSVQMICTLLSETISDEDKEKFTVPHTVYRIKVIEVFAGNIKPGDIVEVMQEGGKIGSRELINDRQVPLSPGNDLIFFLRNFEKYGFGHLPMALVGGVQGVYQIPAEDSNEFADGIKDAYIEDSSVSDLELESLDFGINPKQLTLTVGDLMNVSEYTEDNNSENRNDNISKNQEE